VPRSELVRIIESVLLLNNYALIPGPDPKTVKVINMNAGTGAPQSHLARVEPVSSGRAQVTESLPLAVRLSPQSADEWGSWEK